MYILIMILFSAQGSVAVSTAEFSSYNACNEAKNKVEQTAPGLLVYQNYHTFSCVAK